MRQVSSLEGSSLRGTLTINNAQPSVLPALESQENTVQCLGAYGGCRDRLLLMIKSSLLPQCKATGFGWTGQAMASHLTPAVLSLLTLPLQGLSQAHPIQHPGQLPTTRAVGPPHPECQRVGRLMWVPALGVPSCARLHLAGGVTLDGSRSQEACSGMWESAYRARGAVQASRWGPWHSADLKLKPGKETATGLSAWEIQKLKPNVEEKI